MVYGILQHQHGEFVIRTQEDRDVEHSSFHPDISEKLVRLSTDDTSLTDWHLGFHIYLDMLPEYIHMPAAESILFAGKAVRVLRNPSPAFQFQDQQITRGFLKVQGFTGRFPFQKEPFPDMKLIGEELLPQSQADKIESVLQDLKLLLVRADLNGHLKALKDYFLLAKGDFFQFFLEESRQLTRLPPRQSTAEADLMVPFHLVVLGVPVFAATQANPNGIGKILGLCDASRSHRLCKTSQ